MTVFVPLAFCTKFYITLSFDIVFLCWQLIIQVVSGLISRNIPHRGSWLTLIASRRGEVLISFLHILHQFKLLLGELFPHICHSLLLTRSPRSKRLWNCTILWLSQRVSLLLLELTCFLLQELNNPWCFIVILLHYGSTMSFFLDS